MLAETDFRELRDLVEGQSLRHLRRYLDYGKRVRQGTGLAELHQWLNRILFDRETVYGLQDKASAFEIGACEWLAVHWDELNHPGAGAMTVAGHVDKVLLVRLIVGAGTATERTALATLFGQRYSRTWSWVRERAAQLEGEKQDPPTADGRDSAEETHDGGASTTLFTRFVEELERLDPLAAGAGAGAAELERLLLEASEREARLRREVAAMTDRAERAATRSESLQEELTESRRSIREENDSGEKLREERSRRIRIERESREVTQELDRLKREYLKLDARMREAAQREHGGAPVGNLEELAQLAQLDPNLLLGLPADANEADLAQTRRRFAAAFHSDRTSQLPVWVGELFDQLLGVANAACDRLRR
jgi:hypothetical protein